MRVVFAEHDDRFIVERGGGAVIGLTRGRWSHDQRAVQSHRHLMLGTGDQTGFIKIGAGIVRQEDILIAAARGYTGRIRDHILALEEQRRVLAQRVVQRDSHARALWDVEHGTR